MDENMRNPQEDISLIRQILKRTTDGMKTLAPWFSVFGWLYLIYGLCIVVLRLWLAFASPAEFAHGLAFVTTTVRWVFYFTIVAGYLICRKRQTRYGFDSLASKLLDIWGICIIVYVALNVLFRIILLLQTRLTLSALESSAMTQAVVLCNDMMFYLLPAIPIIITAVFLENRRMLWAGIAVSLLAFAVLAANILFFSSFEVRSLDILRYFDLSCIVLDLAPGAMLLLFGRQLKRE